VDLRRDDGLGQTELRNAVDQHAAGLVERFEHRDLMTLAAHVGRDCDAGRTAADDRDLLAGGGLDLRRGLASALAFQIGDKTLDAPDRDRLVDILKRLA